jgi:hypothetical protein
METTILPGPCGARRGILRAIILCAFPDGAGPNVAAFPVMPRRIPPKKRQFDVSICVYPVHCVMEVTDKTGQALNLPVALAKAF